MHAKQKALLGIPFLKQFHAMVDFSKNIGTYNGPGDQKESVLINTQINHGCVARVHARRDFIVHAGQHITPPTTLRHLQDCDKKNFPTLNLLLPNTQLPLRTSTICVASIFQNSLKQAPTLVANLSTESVMIRRGTFLGEVYPVDGITNSIHDMSGVQEEEPVCHSNLPEEDKEMLEKMVYRSKQYMDTEEIDKVRQLVPSYSDILLHHQGKWVVLI